MHADICRKTCIKPSEYQKFHLFERNLTKAATNSPCADAGYTDFLETDKHGFGPIKAILDMYMQPAAGEKGEQLWSDCDEEQDVADAEEKKLEKDAKAVASDK